MQGALVGSGACFTAKVFLGVLRVEVLEVTPVVPRTLRHFEYTHVLEKEGGDQYECKGYAGDGIGSGLM